MIINKKEKRLRRARKTRLIQSKFFLNRLIVFRSNLHIYASITDKYGKILFSSSTLKSIVSKKIINFIDIKTSNILSSYLLGEIIAKKSIKRGIIKVSFDRSGFKYHGKIKALAESARKYGLIF